MNMQIDQQATDTAPAAGEPRLVDPDVLYQRWRDASRQRDEQVAVVVAMAAGPARDAATLHLDELKVLTATANQAYRDRIAPVAKSPDGESPSASAITRHAERTEPTFDVDIPLDFDSVQEVLLLARRVASENFRQHLAAAAAAANSSDVERLAAGQALGKAIEGKELADRAYKHYMASEVTFQLASGEAVLGHAVPSTRGPLVSPGFAASADHMAKAAEQADRFAAYAPTSTFFQAALTAVMKTDAALAKVESAASAKVEGFVKGLKAFAQRMSDFGAQVAAVPEKTRELATRTSVSTTAAAKSVISRFMGRVRSAASGIAASIEAQVESGVAGAKLAHLDLKQSAWALLDEAADFADRNKDRVAAVVSKVDTHVRAVGGGASLAGGLLATMGRKVVAAYNDQVEQVEATKAVRRATPR